MTILSVDSMRSTILEQLEKKFYKPISAAKLEVERKIAVGYADKLCTKLRKLGLYVWAADSQWALNNREFGFTFNTTLNIKTQTNHGCVCCRLIHDASKRTSIGLSTVVEKMVSDLLRQIPHLAIQTADVIRMISAQTYPERSMFLKLDIKDVYMPGKHNLIIQTCNQGVLEKHRCYIRELLEFLRVYQFIEDNDTQQAYCVLLGTSMGAKHSGAISDFVFWKPAEEPLIEQGCTMSRKHELRKCVRFRDDILSGFDKPAASSEFLRLLKQSASGCYEIETGACNLVVSQMLDLWEWKPEDLGANGKLA